MELLVAKPLTSTAFESFRKRHANVVLWSFEEGNQKWSNCELAEGTSTRIYSEYGAREL